MRGTIKRLVYICTLAICMVVACGSAYAMSGITLPDLEDGIMVTFQAETPDGFAKDIEIYLNSSPYYMTSQSGYKIKVPLEPAEHEIKAIMPDDITDRYQANHAATFNPETEREILIQITDRGKNEGPHGGGEGHNFAGFYDGLQAGPIGPEIFDFSGGKEHGTVLVTRELYGAVKEATYCLVGENGVYEVPLDRDFMGQARVLLPPGPYYESGTIDVQLAPDATVPDGADFLWRHKNNMGKWGDYYAVSANGTITVDDLAVMVAYDGDIFEVDSNLLFSRAYNKNHESLVAGHRQDALESAFPEKYEMPGAETISAASPSGDKRATFPKTAIFVGAAVALAILFACFAARAARAMGPKGKR